MPCCSSNKSANDKAPVTDTNIPSHLEQMLDILVQEENERESGETGPCMEYLLHHKILETLYTLGKADNKLKSLASKGVPNVISEDTLKGQDSLSTDTGQSRQPEELSGAAGMEQTESEDEPPPQKDDLSTSLDNLSVNSLPEASVVRPNQDYNLDGRIAVKACEGLMLLVSLPEPAAAKCLTQSTCLCELLTDRLASLYKALPQSVDPLDIETVEAINWGFLCLVPDEAKSSYHVEGTGYDTYLRDAHRQ
ncbi:Protein FAM160B1, partial [Plecturocebus cupreus]